MRVFATQQCGRSQKHLEATMLPANLAVVLGLLLLLSALFSTQPLILIWQSLLLTHLNASDLCVVPEIVGGAAAASKEDEALVKKLEEQASNMRMVICKA